MAKSPSRDAMPFKLLDTPLVQRVLTGAKAIIGGARINADLPQAPLAPGAQQRIEPSFFPPGTPLTPAAPGAAGRAFDYPTAVNISYRPRSYEPVSFETLRALADAWDLVRLAIETRKDQMAKLEFSIMPRIKPGEKVRGKPDDRCIKIEQFMRRPDRVHPWETWVRLLCEEQLVIDAPAVYCRRTMGGEPWALDIIAGDTITPQLGYDGRRPESGTAYQQILKGLPAVSYTAEEMIYAPRNPRANRFYGCPPVQQILMTINIGLRRSVHQLNWFTEGTVPDAVSQVPPDWAPEQIEQFQSRWDAMMADFTNRRKVKFIPGGVNFIPTKNDGGMMDAFDEWLARVVCFCFSLPPLPFVKQQNRATAETAYDTAIDEGLLPMMSWLKNIVDEAIARWFGEPDLEMVWDDVRKVDPAEKEQRDLQLVRAGIISLDEMRVDKGLDPLGVPNIVFGVGPMGFMAVDDIKKAIAQGMTLNGPQPALGMGGLPPGIDPSLMAQGQGPQQDPLAGVPPDLLAAVGLGPEPQQAAATPITEDDLDEAYQQGHDDAQQQQMTSASASNVIQHPAVRQALHDGERAARRAAATFHRR